MAGLPWSKDASELEFNAKEAVRYMGLVANRLKAKQKDGLASSLYTRCKAKISHMKNLANRAISEGMLN